MKSWPQQARFDSGHGFEERIRRRTFDQTAVPNFDVYELPRVIERHQKRMPSIALSAPVVPGNFPAIASPVNVGLADLAVRRQRINNFDVFQRQRGLQIMPRSQNNRFLEFALGSGRRVRDPFESKNRDNYADTKTEQQASYAMIHRTNQSR